MHHEVNQFFGTNFPAFRLDRGIRLPCCRLALDPVLYHDVNDDDDDDYHVPFGPLSINRLAHTWTSDMGVCFSSEGDDSEARKRTALIDKGIEEDSRRMRRECKILLLGMGEQGSAA